MKAIFTSLLLLVLCSFGFAQAEVQVFEHFHYGGYAMPLHGDWSVQGPDDFWNDKISSIKVPPGWKVVLYEHINFNQNPGDEYGSVMTLTSDWTVQGPDDYWNDRISSMRVIPLECHASGQGYTPAIDLVQISNSGHCGGQNCGENVFLSNLSPDQRIEALVQTTWRQGSQSGSQTEALMVGPNEQMYLGCSASYSADGIQYFSRSIVGADYR